jgi:hypothetical protein
MSHFRWYRDCTSGTGYSTYTGREGFEMRRGVANRRGEFRGRVGRRRRGGATGRLALCLALLAGAGGCAGRRVPVEAVNPTLDGRIAVEVRQRLEREPSVDAARVRVEAEGARVRLFGSVEGIGAWNCALRNAWLVQGVEGVADFLVIERGPPEVRCLAVRAPALSSAPGAPDVTLRPRTARPDGTP